MGVFRTVMSKYRYKLDQFGVENNQSMLYVLKKISVHKKETLCRIIRIKLFIFKLAILIGDYKICLKMQTQSFVN